MPSFTIDTTVDINAGRAAVWEVLSDFASYKEWNPVMRIEGTPEVGAKLVVHLLANDRPGMSFKPKVLAATPGEELRWLGKLGLPGIADGEHFFILSANDDGTTRLNHGERFSGALVALARRSSANSGAAYEAFSRALKQRVEHLGRALVEAVIFDLDGTLLDSEQLWNQSKEAFVRATGGHWQDDAPDAMIGMSSPEWSRYMHDTLRVPLPPEQINRGVVARMEDRYRSGLPLLPGAIEAVRGLSAHWPVALASSANREVIDLVLELSGLAGTFAATVSSEEVARGKPAPDVYLEAAHRLGVEPARSVAIEDSGSGLRSAAAAGMTTIAVPNHHYPPSSDALALAAATITTLHELTPEFVAGLHA